MLTPVLCCSKCSCISLLLVLEGLGLFVIFRLRLLRSLDNVEISYRHKQQVQKRFTLRGFNFPPCLLDIVVVGVEIYVIQILPEHARLVTCSLLRLKLLFHHLLTRVSQPIFRTTRKNALVLVFASPLCPEELFLYSQSHRV